MLTWKGQFPISTCKITAEVVCTNGRSKCSSDQLAYEATLNALLKNASEKTDVTDPNTQRSLPVAMNTMAPGHTEADYPTDWSAYGRKTLSKIPYTTDLTYQCGASGNKETQRLNVTKSNEE
jgi:hypothetical protein